MIFVIYSDLKLLEFMTMSNLLDLLSLFSKLLNLDLGKDLPLSSISPVSKLLILSVYTLVVVLFDGSWLKEELTYF